MQNAVNQRGVEYLVHFTRLENLDSILLNGLISREQLPMVNPYALFNDYLRLDNCNSAICSSITHPNYKMFYSLRKQDITKEWCVIGIKKDVLWEKNCVFCVENAASSNVTSIPLMYRMGVNAFNKLFEEIEGKPTREQLGLTSDCPTNPQAEVLIFNSIEPNYIVGVAFSSLARRDEYINRYPYLDISFIYHRAFFGPRADYAYWK